MEKRDFKDRVYSKLADITKAMANSHRLEIIDFLGAGEKTVEEIASDTNLSVANASQHLQVLKTSNLVVIRRQGNFIYYRLPDDEIYKFIQTIRQLAIARIAEVGKVITDFRAAKNSLEALNINELLDRMKSRNLILLDVRPPDEFEKGHIPGAINMPVNELAKRLKKLPKTKEYIAYCRGPFCVFADEAVHLLKRKGFKVKRLEQGFSGWKVEGLPVGVA